VPATTDRRLTVLFPALLRTLGFIGFKVARRRRSILEGVRIAVKVKPNSKNPRLEEAPEGLWTAYLKAPPIEGRANQELIERLAERFGVPKSRVRITSGAAGRTKLVSVDL
jgi:uncharacterized protein (TIGR00251 family)